MQPCSSNYFTILGGILAGCGVYSVATRDLSIAKRVTLAAAGALSGGAFQWAQAKMGSSNYKFTCHAFSGALLVGAGYLANVGWKINGIAVFSWFGLQTILRYGLLWSQGDTSPSNNEPSQPASGASGSETQGNEGDEFSKLRGGEPSSEIQGNKGKEPLHEATSVNLESKGDAAYCPASEMTILGTSMILSKTPNTLEARKEYYRRVIDTKAEFLVSATAGFELDDSSDEVSVPPGVCFLEPGQSETIQVSDRDSYTVRCIRGVFRPINEAFQKAIGPNRAARWRYCVRELEIYEKQEGKTVSTRKVRQILPDFVPNSTPLTLLVYYVVFLKNLAQETNLSLYNLIINSSTGKDQSAQFALVLGVLNQLERYVSEKTSQEVEYTIDKIDWSEVFLNQACEVEKQTGSREVTQSINQDLLPNVGINLYKKHRDESRIYDPLLNAESGFTSVSKEEKEEILLEIRKTLKKYAKSIRSRSQPSSTTSAAK